MNDNSEKRVPGQTVHLGWGGQGGEQFDAKRLLRRLTPKRGEQPAHPPPHSLLRQMINNRSTEPDR